MLKLNKHLICTTILCTSTLMSGIASADPWDHGPERGGPQGGQPSFSDDRPHHHGHPQDVRYEPDFRQYPHYYHAPEGGQWQRGGYLPRSYWGPNYRINNWQDNGLPPPPSGHRWLHVNGQYILVAAATGIITSILLHH
ncbi:RcnB family protein [Acinetobacter nectaris]|uniref:RcnB family protein n=1 Tax=Acinetobacter nectaris TaxID=1219382 RepID=UPI001F2014AA|nr:RcnB family protein [Acinetobacter nectaris]MCF8998684.1 RcnB family protein [Acinetobacter nectaris]MCF9026402.1 RcnB family protein [Acinetobacter nectaris]